MKRKQTATAKSLGLKNVVQISTYITHKQAEALDRLVAPGGKRAGVAKAELIREAIQEKLDKESAK